MRSAAREQVDRRGAERHQLLRVHRALQALVVLAEQHDQFQLLAVASTQGRGSGRRTRRTGSAPARSIPAAGGSPGTPAPPAAARPRRRSRARRLLVGRRSTQHCPGRGRTPRRRCRAIVRRGGRVVRRRRAGRAAGRPATGCRTGCRRRCAGGCAGRPWPAAGGEAAEHRGGIAEVVGLGHFQRPQGHRVGGAVFAGGLVIGAELAAQEAPRSTLKPLLRAPSLGSGRNCTTVIDRVGAR